MASSLSNPLLLPSSLDPKHTMSSFIPRIHQFPHHVFLVWASGTLNFFLLAWNNNGGGRDPTVFGERTPVKNTSSGRYEFLVCLVRISWFHHSFRSSSASILFVKWNYPFSSVHLYFWCGGSKLFNKYHLSFEKSTKLIFRPLRWIPRSNIKPMLRNHRYNKSNRHLIGFRV